MAQTFMERNATRSAETTGTMAEAAGGIAIIVLAIIGLARVTTMVLSGSMIVPGIATIVLGAALLAEGGAIAAEFSRLASVASDGIQNIGEFGHGLALEFVVGAAILVMGILALVGIAPLTLIEVSVLAAGAMLLVTAPTVRRIHELKYALTSSSSAGGTAYDATGTAAASSETTQALMRTASTGAAAMQVLAGATAVVLGILSLTVTRGNVTLMLVALLVLGAALAMNGSSFASGLGQRMRR